MKNKDLTGQVFDYLTVLEYAYKEKGTNYWKCQCICGKEKIISQRLLLNKTQNPKSCGCKKVNPRFVDITGQTFGYLTAIKQVGIKNNLVIWECKCICGKIKNVPGAYLRNGSVKSCGCMKNKQKTLKRNLVGNRYGKLIVIEIAGKNKQGRIWKCKCDCGNYKNVNEHELLSGDTKSCGCLKYEGLKKYNKNKEMDITGLRFGKLTVIERVGFNDRHCSMWRCKCDCGKEKIAQGSSLKMGLVNSCGCLSSVGENIIWNYLIEKQIQHKREYIFKDLKGSGGKRLRFDFALMKNKTLICLIEFQGKQHYEDDPMFGKQQREETDQLKRDYCKNHNILLYEIKYNENIEEKLYKILRENGYIIDQAA